MREVKTIDLVKDGIRSAAQHRLIGPGYPLPSIERSPSRPADIEDIWLVKIVVSSGPARIQFRVYYSAEQAKLLYHVKHRATKDLPARIYHDYMREFCNLTAGALKVWLVDMVSAVKTDDLVVNLPDQKPAMVEPPLFDKLDLEDHLYDTWAFKIEGLEVLCCSEIEVFDWQQVAHIRPNNIAETADNEDEVEFL